MADETRLLLRPQHSQYLIAVKRRLAGQPRTLNWKRHVWNNHGRVCLLRRGHVRHCRHRPMARGMQMARPKSPCRGTSPRNLPRPGNLEAAAATAPPVVPAIAGGVTYLPTANRVPPGWLPHAAPPQLKPRYIPVACYLVSTSFDKASSTSNSRTARGMTISSALGTCPREKQLFPLPRRPRPRPDFPFGSRRHRHARLGQNIKDLIRVTKVRRARLGT